MKIISSTFNHGGNIPEKYTCKGLDINPPLEFKEVPEGTKSLVLIMHDPDAPAGDWVHWLLWNIDPKITSIEENSIPKDSVPGTTSFGDAKYGGPCPPSGTHHYVFEFYALNTKLGLKEGSTIDQLNDAMGSYILEKAELIGLFSK